MTTAILIVIAVLLAALVVLVWLQRPRLLQMAEIGVLEPETSAPLLKHTVIVHTQSGDSIRGVLLAEHDDRLTLTQAIFLEGTSELAVDGLVHVPRTNVGWMQSDLTAHDRSHSTPG